MRHRQESALPDPFSVFSRHQLERWLIGALFSRLLSLEDAQQLARRLRREMFRPSLQPFFNYFVTCVWNGQIPIDHTLALAHLAEGDHLKPSQIDEILAASDEVVTPTAWPGPVRLLHKAYYRDRLAELIKRTDPEDPAALEGLLEELEALQSDLAELRQEWRVLSVEDCLGLAERELIWDVKGLLPHRTLGIIAGPPKSGKSLLALDLALALATGGDFLGYSCQKRRVLFIEEEDSDYRLARRLRRLLQGRGLEEEADLGLELLIRAGVRLDERESLAKLRELIKTRQAEVLILDVFRRLWSGNENYQNEVQPVLNDLAALAEECDISILLLHHTRKAQGDRRAKRLPIEEIAGSGALGAWSEVTLALDPDARGKELCLTIISKDTGQSTHLLSFEDGEDGGLRLVDLGEPEELGTRRSREARERYLKAIEELGCPTISQLARHLGRSKPTVSRFIRRLVNEGLVETVREGGRGSETIIRIADGNSNSAPSGTDNAE